MERRKTFFFPYWLNSQKGEVLSVTMLHQLYIKVQEKKAKLLFFLGKKNKNKDLCSSSVKKNHKKQKTTL